MKYLTNSIDGNEHLLSRPEGESPVPHERKLVWAVHVDLEEVTFQIRVTSFYTNIVHI